MDHNVVSSIAKAVLDTYAKSLGFTAAAINPTVLPEPDGSWSVIGYIYKASYNINVKPNDAGFVVAVRDLSA